MFNFRSEKEGDVDHDEMYKSYRMTSDLDSQVSLPRSYTLPRQFKYYRKPKQRKPIRTEHFIASTNSSDGKFLPVIFFFIIHPQVFYFKK